jgi:hypothetical protein
MQIFNLIGPHVQLLKTKLQCNKINHITDMTLEWQWLKYYFSLYYITHSHTEKNVSPKILAIEITFCHVLIFLHDDYILRIITTLNLS